MTGSNVTGSLTRAAILKGLALHIKKAGFEDYSNTYTAIDFEEERLVWGSVEHPSRLSKLQTT
ncbi:hypothetical protein N9771_00745 [Flavobacteriaceae bacterium]|nr:hypothetical protein [Flavobacteriaceae bacterium]